MNSKIIPLLAIALLLCGIVYAQSSRQNIDFEDGNLNLWSGKTGNANGVINTPGLVNGRHTIVSGSGTDPNSLDSITLVAPNGQLYSVRLGNSNIGSQGESLSRSFLVTKENANFIYQYAVILEDPSGHSQADKPTFEVRIMDSVGVVVPGPCGYYQVIAGPATDTWFRNGDVRFKKWTTVGIDLSSYIGQTMTVQFSTEDCGLSGHYGYAYVDATYAYLDIVVNGYCGGTNQVSLSAPEGFVSYYWPATNQHSKSIYIPQPTAGDSIVVELVNEAGCPTMLVHIFEDLPIPHAAAGNDTLICAGSKITLQASGGGENGSYQWTSNNGTFTSNVQNPLLTPSQTTTYTVKVVNANGCVAPDSMASYTVTVDTSLVFNLLDPPMICLADTATIYGPVKSGVAYTWTSSLSGFSQNTKDIKVSPTATTKYYLTISNSSCFYRDSVMVNVYTASSTPDILTDGFCMNDTVVVVEGLTGFSNYLWSDGTTSINDTIYHPVHNQTIKLYIKNSAGCNDSIRYVLSRTAPLAPLAFASDNDICLGSSTQLMAFSGSGSTYQWTATPAMNVVNISNPWVTPTQSTIFVVQAYNKYGCTDSTLNDTVHVRVNTDAFVNLPEDTLVCPGNTLVLSSPGSTGTFSWSANPANFSSTDSVITLHPNRDQTYFLTVNTNGCDASDEVFVHMYHPIIDSLSSVYCAGVPTVSLDGPSASPPYQWSSGELTEDLEIGNPSGFVNRILSYTNTLGCKDTLVYHLDEVQPSPNVSVLQSQYCKGDNINVELNSSYSSYNWEIKKPSSTTNSSSVSVTDNLTEITTYTVRVTDVNGCEGIDSIVVSPSSITISLPTSIQTCAGSTITLDAQNAGATYLWSDSSTAQTINITNAGVYSVQVSKGKCVQTASSSVNFLKILENGFVPNIITPNNDGLNDQFELNILASDFKLRIYNRFGVKVFESINTDLFWDGIINGSFASDGTYYYVLEFKADCDGGFKEFTGYIQVINSK